MSETKRKIVLGGMVLVAVIALLFYYFLHPMLAIITGYSAKVMCTCTFAQGRIQEDIQSSDLAFTPVFVSESSIDHEKKSVTSHVFGFQRKTAVYRQGLGCILLQGQDDYGVNYPDLNELDQTIDSAYTFISGETHSFELAIKDKLKHFAFQKDYQTRALLILHKDTLVLEEYAEGFDLKTPQLGWSMTKSVMSALIGILYGDGKVDIEEDNLFEEWNDRRSDIKLKNLLNMDSGLEWDENYSRISDATHMLYNDEDIVKDCIDNNLLDPPGSQYYYSSGTTNLLSGYLREKLANDSVYWTFPKVRLFDPIGMENAFIETDESGNFIASSYMYATPRDWARFGRLFLRNGNWHGKQIISEEWVKWCRSASKSSNGLYGFQFYQNENGSAFPSVPHDAFFMEGYQGQRIFIIPSLDLVVVRLGLKKIDDALFLNTILSEINFEN